MKACAGLCVLLVVACAGCAQYCHTGNPGCFGDDTVNVPKQNLDAVEAGMTRGEVVKIMGSPTDEALTFMHWQTGRYGDAWVVFDDYGAKVASKYWSDEETLRLADVPGMR